MQIVIDIDENVFTRLFDNGIEDYAIVNDDLFKIAKAIRTGIPFEKIRAEIERIEISGQIDEHTAFIRTGDQVKQMVLDIIDKYKAESEDNE